MIISLVDILFIWTNCFFFQFSPFVFGEHYYTQGFNICYYYLVNSKLSSKENKAMDQEARLQLN